MKLLHLWVLLLSPLLSVAQEYSYTHYDTKDGLAGSTVHAIAQSRDGFIWFGTETGLSRFDGVKFKTYTIADGLPANEITGIYVDSRDRIWLVPFQKSICYLQDGKIHNQENDSLLRRIRLHDSPKFISECSNGDILVQEYDFTYVVSRNGNLRILPWGILRPPERLDPGGGLFQFRSASIMYTYMCLLPDQVKSQAQPGWFFLRQMRAQGKAGYFFVGTAGLKMITDEKTVTMPLRSLKTRIMFLSDHEYALCDDVQDAKIFDLNRPGQFRSYLPGYLVHYITRDAEQNLWFATKGSGVFKISPNHFKNLFTVNEKGGTYIRDIHKIGAAVYIGGFNRKYWQLKPVTADFFRQNTGNKPLPFATNDAFLKHIPADMLIHTGSSDFLNLEKHGFNPWYSPKTIQFFGDTLLLATNNSTELFSISRNLRLRPIFYGRSTCAYRLNGIYYVGTLDGLYSMASEGKMQYLGDRFPEFRNEISTFARGTDNTLWIGSNGAGIWGYRNGSIKARIGRKEGLASDVCRCLFVQGNALWAGTDKGLCKIEQAGDSYKVAATITADDGLSSNIINTVFADGPFVYAGTAVGVTVFDERNLKHHGLSLINMTGITVSGRSLDPGNRQIRLAHKDNNISFEYAGISFLSEGAITYKYRITGLEPDWKITTERALTYPSLPSGSYTLELKAINKFGDESKALIYNFEIEQSLSETIAFKLGVVLLCMFVVSLIVYAIIRERHRRATEQLTFAHKIDSLEQMALRAQMNPHFIFNCLNSMQEYILQGDVRKANFYLTRFAGLVRDTFNNATKVYITLEQELSYLSAYIDLERMKHARSFDYEIRVDPGIATQVMKIPNMVLQPYVENAIKHGVSQMEGRGKLVISFNLLKEKQLLECIIEDNGVGIQQAQKYKVADAASFSKSMSITDKRILTLNQLNPKSVPISLDITDKGGNEDCSGTIVTIHFPI